MRPTKPCVDCGAPCSKGSRGRCKPCGYASRANRPRNARSPDPQCRGCGTKVSRSSSTGFCVSCFNKRVNSDPEIKARRAAGVRRKFEDPAHRARMAKVMTTNHRRAMKNPLMRQAAQARGRFQYRNYLSSPEARAKCAEAVRAASWKITEAHLGWCPLAYRELYQHLTRNKRLTAKEARNAVEQQISADCGHVTDPLALKIKMAGLAQ